MDIVEKIGPVAIGVSERFGRALGPHIACSLGRALGGLVGYFTPREQRIVAAQLGWLSRNYPGFKGLTAKELLKGNYQHIGETVCELPHFRYLLEKEEGGPEIYPSYKRVQAEGVEECRDVVCKGEGALFLSAHLGNFELLAAYHIASGNPLTILGREPNYKFLLEWVKKIRGDYGGNSLLRGAEEGGSKRQSAVATVKALKENHVIALLPDQDTALGSEFAPFFGLEAAFTVVPIRMAVKNRKRVFSSFIVRTDKLTHRAFTHEIHYDPDAEDAERGILAEFSARLERLVAEYPEQYLWFHIRWRRRPGIDYQANPGALRSSDEYIKWLQGEPE